MCSQNSSVDYNILPSLITYQNNLIYVTNIYFTVQFAFKSQRKISHLL